MGIATRLEIVSEGQLLAQRDDAAALATTWLQRWLNAVAASWPWPVLQQEALDVPVTSHVLELGGNEATIEDLVFRILDNCWVYTADKTTLARVRIKPQQNKPTDRLLAATNVGVPTAMRVFQPEFGKWTAYLDPAPDKPYLMSVPYLKIPAQMVADDDVPWYPNDETMVQAVAFKCHEYFDGKDSDVTNAAQQLLSQSLANDRIRYGAVTGINDVLQLSLTRFTRAKSP